MQAPTRRRHRRPQPKPGAPDGGETETSATAADRAEHCRPAVRARSASRRNLSSAPGHRTAVPRHRTSPATAQAPSVSRTCSSRSEEHTSELQSLMRISYAVFCLKKKNKNLQTSQDNTHKNDKQ